MGFFSSNRHSSLYNSYEFPVVEGYTGTVGCGLALIEGYQNDLALFSAAVSSDLAEMGMMHEGASEGDVCYLQEASVSGMIEAIKKFLIKLGAKIKAIFTGFMAKLEGYFTKDLKSYVKKYEKSLDRKDFKDMKVKIHPLKGDSYTVAEVYNPGNYTIRATANYTKSDEDVNKTYEDHERDDDIKNAYHTIVNNKVDNNSDFDSWYHDELFDSEEVKDDWDYTKVKAVARRLTDNTKTLADIKKFYDKVQGDIKSLIKNIDDEEKRINKLWKDSKDGTADTGIGYKANVSRITGNYTGSGDVTGDPVVGHNNKRSLNVATKQVSLMRMKASAYQDVVLHISQVVMKEAKFAIAQDKKVFAKAVAYKTITKEATLLDMIEECAFDETIEDLDRIA